MRDSHPSMLDSVRLAACPLAPGVRRTHVAVLLPRYVDLLLAGRKTVESRLSLTRREPLCAVAPGERIYFKERGGPIRAVATVEAAEFFGPLTPRLVRMLRGRLNAGVMGDAAYWAAKAEARYASFFHLSDVEPALQGPPIPVLHGRAWVTLCSPMSSRRAAAG
jgi:hypothetical protein